MGLGRRPDMSPMTTGARFWGLSGTRKLRSLAMDRTDTISGRFDAIVRRYADLPAVEGERITMSYRELDEASRRLAERLGEEGVGTGSFVPMLMRRSPAFVVGVLGVLRCGGAYAPIDPESPLSRREAMLNPLRARVCLADPDIDAGPGLVSVDPADAIGHGRGAVRLAESDSRSGPDAPAYVMYTSGSTGEPKGVVVPQRAVLRLVVDADFATMTPGQRWGVLSAVAFDASTLEVWGALLNGGCCVVQESPYPALDELARFIRNRRIACTWLTASLFNAMVDSHCDSMAGMSQLFTGGERESVRHMRSFKERCPGVTLIHGYGPTENTTFSLCRTITAEEVLRDRVPIGRPIRGSTARIVEPGAEADEPPAPLEQGELLVGGKGLALGYLGRDDLTAEKFVYDAEGVRWYRTGDLVRRLPCGEIEFLGRIDRQVKIRGHRIEPDEVETALASCKGVRHAAVLVRGETAEDRHLVGVYVPEDGVGESQIRARLAELLPRTMIPERFVVVEELPRGLTGKIDRKALEARLDASANHTSERHGASGAPPLTTTEALLIDLVRGRLPLAGPIGRRSAFGALGGHSLAAMRLCADVYDALGVRLAPVDVLRLQDIDQIAAHIDDLRSGEPTAEDPSPASQSDEVGDIQRRVLLESERDPTGRAMLVHQAWIARPGIEASRLQSIWSELIGRHEALRTAFSFESEGVYPVHFDPGDAVWFCDHGGLDSDPASPDLPQAVIGTIAQRIGPDEMPLRLHHWRMDDGSSLIVAAFHHAAIDEWSLELIEADFASMLDGNEPANANQYAVYAALERSWLDHDAAAEVAEQLAKTGPAKGSLPVSGPQPGVVHEFGDNPDEIGRVIELFAKQRGVSPAAAMLGLFGDALQSLYGDPGRWVMTPLSKRVRPELQSLVGCCLDMRIIDCAAGTDDRCASGSIQRQIRDAQGESVLPVERVIAAVRNLNPEAVGHATRFGFTYRVIDDAPKRAGSHTLTPITVPQLAARFGIALHVERRSTDTRMWLEASASSTKREDLETIASSMLCALGLSAGATTATQTIVPPGATTPTTPAPQPASVHAADHHHPRTVEVLASLWTDALGTTPDAIPDFYASGGSSLKAMQLGASIHDRTGLKLHVGEFLREPSFDGLLRWVREDHERPYSNFRRTAAPAGATPTATGDEVMLAFPGSSGRAIDLHPFWTAYSERVGAVERMLGFDLVTIAHELSTASEPERIRRAFFDRAVEVAMAEAQGRPIRVMGYSLGGVLALGVADELVRRGFEVRRLVLLDGYTPAFLVRSWRTVPAKVNARLRHTLRPNSPTNSAPAPQPQGLADKALPANRELWRHIHRAFANWTVPTIDAPTVLVRSDPAQRRVRPLLHHKTNGLGPRLRGPVSAVGVEVGHLQMLTTEAAAIAKAAADAEADLSP